MSGPVVKDRQTAVFIAGYHCQVETLMPDHGLKIETSKYWFAEKQVKLLAHTIDKHELRTGPRTVHINQNTLSAYKSDELLKFSGNSGVLSKVQSGTDSHSRFTVCRNLNKDKNQTDGGDEERFWRESSGEL